MFGSLGNLGAMADAVRQAQQMAARWQQTQAELAQRRVTGSGGGGKVTVELNGLQEVLGVRIDPALLAQPDRQQLEALIQAAMSDALSRSRQVHSEAMQSLTGGMNIPGLDQLLSKLGGPRA